MAAVTAIVGSGNDARIRCDDFEDDDDNALESGAVTGLLLVEVDNEEPRLDILGRGDLTYATATITCRGRTRAEARTLAEAVKFGGTNEGTGLNGYAGTFDAYLEDTDTAAVPKKDASNDYWHDVLLTYNVSFAEQR